MNNIKYKITPLGFSLLIFIATILFITIGGSLRNVSPSNKLLYSINNNLNNKEYAFKTTIKINSKGDIIKTKPIDLFIDTNFYSDKKGSFSLYDTNFKLNDTLIAPFDTIYKDKNIFFKESSNSDINLEHLVDIIDITDKKLLSILSSNLISIKTHFNDYIYYKNKDEIILELTFEDFFYHSKYVVEDFLNHKYFKDAIVTRMIKFNSVYEKSPIIKILNLNSSKIFSNLVEYNNNFEVAIYNNFDERKKDLFKTFRRDSTIRVSFLLSDSEVKTITSDIVLKYNSSEGFENINILIEDIPYENITELNKDNLK